MNTRIKLFTGLIVAVLVLTAPFGAMADDVVPKLPPVPQAADPGPPADNWLWLHTDDTIHPPRAPEPAPLTEVVTPENPLKVDVYYSMRSPYSYLVLQRLLYLNSNYNVDMTVKVIFPVAVRNPGQAAKREEGKVSGRWYKWADTMHDTARVGKYQGVPFRFAAPDPIKQDTYPTESASMVIAPLEEQPYIAWLVRLAAAAQLAGKSNEYVWAVSPLIWGARSEPGEWPKLVPEAFERGTGLDYKKTIKDIQKNPEKYDAVWQQNQKEQLMSGQGGVPNMVYRGEPFFGQDRFDLLFWRLEQNGLTTRPEPIAPIVTKPQRWPDG